MFLWARKSGCWKWSAILTISLSNALEYKSNTNLLLVGGHVEELHHSSILLIDVPGEVPVHPHRGIIRIHSKTVNYFCQKALT